MQQLSDRPSNPSKPADLPLSVRIMPNRSAPQVALAASIAACVAALLLFEWFTHNRHQASAIAIFWIVFALGAVTAIGAAIRLLLQLPIIEASELGIAVWLYGPYRRPFFAPWSRVREVGLTQVRSADAAPGSSPRNALGIELNCDGGFDLPRSAGREVTVDDAARADLAWSNRSISGDLLRWVALLQAMKSAYAAERQRLQ